MEKYQVLVDVAAMDRNAFFSLFSQQVAELLSILYTPGVGEACLHWSELARRPPGLYVSAADKGKMTQIVATWPEPNAKIAVITDGERILGLGDLGAQGMGIPVGKAYVYTAGAGLHPRYIVPVTLDVGCNTEQIRSRPAYIGLRQERVRGEEYDELVDELVVALRMRYGPRLLLHWEDFAARNAFRLLQRYQDQGGPSFSDDIQATGAITLAALLGAACLPRVPPLRRQTVLFFGAGQANVGAASLLQRALMDDGASRQEANARIFLYDSKGIVFLGRDGGLSTQKARFARSSEEGAVLRGASLADVILRVRPTALVGAAARPGSFSPLVLRALAQGCQEACGAGTRCIVLALSNPSSVAECSAQEAYAATGGNVAYASGTAFAPFHGPSGNCIFPAQANNALVFPGLGFGVVAAGIASVTDKLLLAAARSVAASVTHEEASQESILPHIDRIREVSLNVAAGLGADHQGGRALSNAFLNKDGGGGNGNTDKAWSWSYAKAALQTKQYNPVIPDSGLF